MLEINPLKEKSLFSRLATALDDIETQPLSQNIVIANQSPSTTLNDIGEQLSKYARHLEQTNPKRPRKLPVMAG